MKTTFKYAVALAVLLIGLTFSVSARQTVRILAIGNSFSEDAVENYLYDLAAAEDIDFIIGNAYIGGCSLERHWNNARKDSIKDYSFRKVVNGVKTEMKQQTIRQCIENEAWDYISLQQVSQKSGIYDSYFPYLDSLIVYVNAHVSNPNFKFILHQTWAYAQNSTHGGFRNYNNSQLSMYNAIMGTHKRILKGKDSVFQVYIPSGTAIQNVRSSIIGDRLCRDGFHLSYDLGRYTAACTWFEALTGIPVEKNPYKPAALSAREAKIARKAAHNAIQNPFEISPVTVGMAQYDAVVYGGTSAAVTAAVQLARMNKSVAIVMPEIHLGGMTSSGLGFTDTGNKAVIGGIAREFYQRVYAFYQQPANWRWQKKEEYGNKGQGTPAIDGDNRTQWIFEPHAAEQIFEDFVAEYNIPVFRNQWLNREKGVKKKKGKIVSIAMLDGNVYSAKMFIDATYEGDLMAASGVSYSVGREPNAKYGETWNGVQTGAWHHSHHFGKLNISPYKIENDPSSGIIPFISTDSPGRNGEGDKRIQAYCFRMCLTDEEANRRPFEQPENYDPERYELLARILDKGWQETFNKFDPIPNRKTDVNNHGPFSFDYIGMNYDYPEASYRRRAEIIREHENYQKGMLYFYACDPRVPEKIRNRMNRWGWAKDEFIDNGNFPYQIYVREARRMNGEFVMTENEVLGKKTVPKPVGMGSYSMDSHNTQRYITADGYVQNEGDIGVSPERPYQIDMGAIMPSKRECRNLLVPVAVSSSHIAYGSIRMEPVFMILGQSAATIAGMAIDGKKEIHDLNYSDIREVLLKDKQALSY
ncbi:MAG: FAD-dependent oxidoreductase [Prevotella sp.]|jgi:hypothetical protein|nr:FAD-dependent oxidoreductase [Prevotella sp.]